MVSPFSVVVWRSEMVAKFFIKVSLYSTDKIYVTIEGYTMISSKQRELINKAVKALNDVNTAMGFRVISVQTLDLIVSDYRSKYNAPMAPSVNDQPWTVSYKPSEPPARVNEWPPHRVQAYPSEPAPENVISINRPK